MDNLVDALADIPKFLQQSIASHNAFTGVFPETYLDRNVADGELLKFIKRLKELHLTWEGNHPNAYWPVASRSRPPSIIEEDGKSPSPPFETVLRFTDLWRAHDFCLINVAFILAFALLEDAGGSELVQKILLDTFPLYSNCSIQDIVNLICRSADYLLLDEHGSLGYIIFTFPATVAYLYMDKDLPQAKYLMDIAVRNSTTSGFGFGDFVLKMPTPLSKWMDDCRARQQQEQQQQQPSRTSSPESPDTQPTTPDEQTAELAPRTSSGSAQ